MNYILFDGNSRIGLLPLTYTKPVAELRIGILTIREKWEMWLGETTSTVTEDYLENKFPLTVEENNMMIDASFLPNKKLVDSINKLGKNQAIRHDGEIIAYYSEAPTEELSLNNIQMIDFDQPVTQLKHSWDIFSYNGDEIKSDFEILTSGRESAPIPAGVHCMNRSQIFLEEGVTIEIGVLNANNGPIYLGKNSEVMEGSMIRGPFALGEHSVVKMGSKIYGDTTLGPKCKIGGEVNNVVLSGYSSKGHEGYLGNAVLGEWCNLGADTNNSNLKNNYAEVKMWSYKNQRFQKTGLQFCGLVMGDHSKTGINTMLNTGTIIGVFSNIYGSNFPRNFIPSFAWGGAAGFTTYHLNKVFDTAALVIERKNEKFTSEDKDILEKVFELSEKYRNFI